MFNGVLHTGFCCVYIECRTSSLQTLLNRFGVKQRDPLLGKGPEKSRRSSVDSKNQVEKKRGSEKICGGRDKSNGLGKETEIERTKREYSSEHYCNPNGSIIRSI